MGKKDVLDLGKDVSEVNKKISVPATNIADENVVAVMKNKVLSLSKLLREIAWGMKLIRLVGCCLSRSIRSIKSNICKILSSKKVPREVHEWAHEQEIGKNIGCLIP